VADQAMEPAPPTISVILCTHNGARHICEQVDAVLGQEGDIPFELVVVDNDSTDGTASLVRAHVGDDPRVRIVTATERHRLGYARNVGANAARAELITFVDDDDRVGPGWLAALAADLESHPVVAMRLILDEINDPVAAQSRGHRQVHGIDHFGGIPVASFIALPKAMFLGAGGNDELLPSAEDVDFAIRLYETYGIEPHWCPDATYHYRLRPDPESAFRQGLSYGKAMPTVYRRWRHHCPQPTTRRDAVAALRDSLRLLVMTPLVARDPKRRIRWSYRSGIRLGRVIGSVRARIVYL